MQIWDLMPAYLSPQHLLAEHREIHALLKLTASQVEQRQHQAAGLVQWYFYPHALSWRHQWLVEEFKLVEIEHSSPLVEPIQPCEWPTASQQPNLIAQMCQQEGARVPMPTSDQALLQQSAFSLQARDPKQLSGLLNSASDADLTLELVVAVMQALQRPVRRSLLDQVIISMWDHCSEASEARYYAATKNHPIRLLRGIQFLAQRYRWPELWHSTALAELACCPVIEDE